MTHEFSMSVFSLQSRTTVTAAFFQMSNMQKSPVLMEIAGKHSNSHWGHWEAPFALRSATVDAQRQQNAVEGRGLK